MSSEVQPQSGFIQRWKEHFFPTGEELTAQRITKYATTVLIVCAVAIAAAILISKFPAASYVYYSAFGIAGAASIYLLVTNYKQAQAERAAAKDQKEE